MPENRDYNEAGFVTLDYIVKNVMVDNWENTEHNYMRYLQWAFRGLKQINFDVLRDVRTVVLTMNDNRTVDLPLDFVNYTKIGVCVNGFIKVLGTRRDMCLTRSLDNCGNVVRNDVKLNCSVLDDFGPYTYLFYNYRNGENVGQLFGVGGGRNHRGYYRVDTKNRQISFTTDGEKTDVVIEYISDGVSPTGKSKIHVFAEECLIKWIHWQRIDNKKGENQAEKERKRREYYNEFRKLRARMKSFTLDELLATFRSSYAQSPKF